MIAALADIWTWPETAEVAEAPEPKRRPAPVLIGDILVAPGGEPELLIRWRNDRNTER